MRRSLQLLLVTICFLSVTQAQAYRYSDQDDIPSWAEDSIDKVREKHIMTGSGDGYFRPKEPLNRAQAVTLLSRLEGAKEGYEPVSFPDNLPFDDVNAGDWFYESVKNAYNKGWVNGRTESAFDPAGTLTKAEWITMIVRAFDLEDEITDPVDYKDVPSQVWFSPYVRIAAKNDFIRFPNSKYYGPAKEVTRTDAAWLIGVILDKPRLMGTSAESDMASRNPRTSGRSRVAVKPKDFNPNLQGHEIEKKALRIIVDPEGEVTLSKDSDYQSLGSFKVENTLEDYAQFDSINFRMLFDSSGVGPQDGFVVKMESGDAVWESQTNKRGGVIFSGMDIDLKNGESVDFVLSIKMQEDFPFFQKAGTGNFYIFEAGGIVSRVFQRSGRSGQRYAPITIESRDFANVYFDPTK